MNKIIAVHKGQIITVVSINTCITRGRQSTIFLMNNPNAIILPSIFIADCRASIRRTIIHKNNFQIRITLRKNAVYTGTQIFFYIVNWNNHANKRLNHTKILP